MDPFTLVDREIEDGGKLLEQLRQEGIDVTAACWIKADEDEQWYLYIATPLVDDPGPAVAYRRIYSSIKSMTKPFSIEPLRVKLVGANNPVAKAVLDVNQKYPAAPPPRYLRTRLGGINIEAAYVYAPMHP
jgi:hypothetical protein